MYIVVGGASNSFDSCLLKNVERFSLYIFKIVLFFQKKDVVPHKRLILLQGTWK